MTRIPVEERRQALVQAALEVIADSGLAAATTRAIVARADMSLASFHYAFPSREALLIELIDSVTKGEMAALADIVEQAPSVEETVEGALLAYLDFLVEHSAREHAMLELTHYALHHEGMRDVAVKQYESYWGTVGQLLDAVCARFDVEWTIPREAVARHVVMLTDGITMSWLVDHNTEECRQALQAGAAGIAQFIRPRTA